jgi:hypothetical protein
VYWLAESRKAGESPDKVDETAVAKAGYKGEAAKLTAGELTRAALGTSGRARVNSRYETHQLPCLNSSTLLWA